MYNMVSSYEVRKNTTYYKVTFLYDVKQISKQSTTYKPN